MKSPIFLPILLALSGLFSNPLFASYCPVNGGISGSSYINNIMIKGLSNPTGNNGGYADFTGLSATLTRGETVNFAMSAPTGLNYHCWIDWNGDMDFNDAGEFYQYGAHNGYYPFTVNVPLDAHLGQTRVRFMTCYLYVTDPCFTGSFAGEVEDYSINIACASTGNTASEWVESFKVQTGGPTYTNGNNGGYSDNSMSNPGPVQVYAGHSFDMTFNPGFTAAPRPENWRIWLDKDDDHLFETDEILLKKTNTVASVSLTAKVPTDLGAHRMRVNMRFNGNGAPAACGTGFDGETEDFLIEIVPSPCGGIPNLNGTVQSPTSIMLHAPAVPFASTYYFRFRPVGSTTWALKTSANPVALITGLTSGIEYECETRVKCPFGLTDWVLGSTFTLSAASGALPCTPPGNGATTNITSAGAKIWWQFVQNTMSYQVRYGTVGGSSWTQINANPANKTLTGLLPSQEYEFQVSAKCSPTSYSDWSSSFLFTTLPLAKPGSRSDETGTETETEEQTRFLENENGLSVSPNPVGDFLKIKIADEPEITEIAIFDLSGKQVKTFGAENQSEIQTAGLPPGLYLLRVGTAAGGVLTQKFLKD